LHTALKDKKYQHGGYFAFNISDPKPRNIHKASVKDRLLHHALYRKLYPFFDRMFIADSYSCRMKKGTHRALDRFSEFARKVSCNNSKTICILKCDIKKFFASIDHGVLLNILNTHVYDKDIISLLRNIVGSFHATKRGKGLPLGNLTSQLLVNIYMNEFDQYVKHKLKAIYYIRYADDFLIMSSSKAELESYLIQIRYFLEDNLLLSLHPHKVSISRFSSGVDFLGWLHFPTYRVLRTVTKRRMLKNLKNNQKIETSQSYLGMLSHGNTYKIKQNLPILPLAEDGVY